MLRRYRLTVTLEHERRRAIARIDIPWRCKTEISTLISNVIIGSTLKLPFLLLVDQFYTSKWIIFTLVATQAAKMIAPWQDSVELDMATDAEKASLLAWKKYRVLLNRVDISTAPDVEWPESPPK